MREVVIDAGSFSSPWGSIGGPPGMYDGELRHMDPVIAASPEDVMYALRPGGVEFRGVRFSADRSGLVTVTCPAGTWVYELFPAVWSDGDGPAIYLAVWPD